MMYLHVVIYFLCTEMMLNLTRMHYIFILLSLCIFVLSIDYILWGGVCDSLRLCCFFLIFFCLHIRNFKQSRRLNRTMDRIETWYLGRSSNSPQVQGHRSRSLQGQGHYRVPLFEISCASCVHIACPIFTKLGMVLVYIIAIHLHDLKGKVIPGSRSLFSCFV